MIIFDVTVSLGYPCETERLVSVYICKDIKFFCAARKPGYHILQYKKEVETNTV